MKLIRKISQEGFVAPIKRRLGWYRSRLQVENRTVGRLVEIFGNRVRMDGLRYSVDSPLISTPRKSTLYFGLHEMDERALVKSWIDGRFAVIEFGGGLGVVSCLTNRRLPPGTNHVVVEANPMMIPLLERNRDLNGCTFKVINRALAYDQDWIALSIDPEFVGSSAVVEVGANDIKVPTIQLGPILHDHGFGATVVVCDIEGLERELIRREILQEKKIVGLLAEMHPAILGEEEVDRLLAETQAAGFTVRGRVGDSVYLERAQSGSQ
jgi:FkbM family methyltransferase